MAWEFLSVLTEFIVAMSEIWYYTIIMKDDSQSIGHERIVAVLGWLFRARQMGHAYLFSGPRHGGKHTIARALLEILSKKEIIHVDRLTDEDGKQSESVGIDQIRGIIRTLSLSLPDQDSYRIILIHDAESVTQEAGNALLKSMEEPPERTIFILFEHFFGRILSTLRSRCAQIRFPLVSDAHIREIVKDDDIVHLSAGRPGSARILSSPDALAFLKKRVAMTNHFGEWENFSKEQNEMKYKKEDGETFELALHRQIQETAGDPGLYSQAAARYDAFQRIRMCAEAHVYQPGLIEACV